MPALKCVHHPPSTSTTHRRTQCQQFNCTPPSPNSLFPAKAQSVFPSSLFSSATLYDDLEERTAAVQSVTAAILSLSEYSETNFIRGCTRASRTVYRGSCTWFQDYLATNPVYRPHDFARSLAFPNLSITYSTIGFWSKSLHYSRRQTHLGILVIPRTRRFL